MMPKTSPISLRWFWILLLLPLACSGKKTPPAAVPAQEGGDVKSAQASEREPPPPEPTKLPVPADAVGWGQIAPADFAAAAGIWTGNTAAPMPEKPLGIALFVTADGLIDAAFYAPKSAPVGGTHTTCFPVGSSCWFTRPDRAISGEVREKTIVAAGSVLTVSLAHPKAAALLDARPLLKSLQLRELTLRTVAGRIEAEVTPLSKKPSQELIDAAHYWLMLAVNERASFLRAPAVGTKFFDALPGATLGVKKNTIHFAMAGDCSMLAWSLQAMHQLYPYLRP